MIDITVKVPENRVAEFYSMFGNWLAGTDSPDQPNEELRAWSASDLELCQAVWGKFSEAAKRLFVLLMDNPGEKFSGDELAQLVGLPNGKHGVAGVLAWPGRHCQAAGRRWLWSWNYPEGGNARYWMTEEVADLFRQVRDA